MSLIQEKPLHKILALYNVPVLTDKNSKKLHDSAGEIYLTICVESAEDRFWSRFDVNRSTVHKDMHKNGFYIFVLSDLDL